MVSDDFKEKRNSPRISTGLGLNISERAAAKALDFSEGGLSFTSKEVISSPRVSLSLKFPDKEEVFKAEAQLVWQRDTGSGDSLYGVKFIKLNNSQKEALRKELIESQINKLTINLKDDEAKEYIRRFFSADMLEYINKTTELIDEHLNETGYSRQLEEEIEHLNNKIMLKGYCLELLLSDKKVLRQVKESFRNLAGAWIYKSAIVKRAFQKPQGYPEDCRMLDLIYENKPVSGNIGLYFDNIFLKSPYSVSIRNRKNCLSGKITDFINQNQSNIINVLSVCSGTGREVFEALPLFNSLKKINFTFVETDIRALDFLKSSLAGKEKRNVSFDFKPESVFRMLGKADFLKNYSRQNLIYTLGIIDYLSDRAAKKIIKILYGLLEEGGRLILTHRNKDKTFPPIPPDWLCDWRVISRDKDQMENLFYQSGISNFSLDTESDNFGYIYYFTLTKGEGR